MPFQYAEFEKFSVKQHPELNEKWVQERIAENPSILGLGDLVLRNKERIQPRPGRYRIRLTKADASEHAESLAELFAEAFEHATG